MKRIGLTGGIGSGKSLVGDFLKTQGVPVIDADTVVHQLLAEDAPVRTAIRETFGADIFTPDGRVDRPKLGAQVFAHPDRRRVLEGLLHPPTRVAIDRFFEAHAEAPLAVAMIPLLFESGLQDRYDETWLVVATEAQQMERLQATRGLSREEALARIHAQMPLDEKKARADVLIDNTGSPEATQRQVSALLQHVF